VVDGATSRLRAGTVGQGCRPRGRSRSGPTPAGDRSSGAAGPSRVTRRGRRAVPAGTGRS
jgi:hypothetical protein